MLFVFQFGVEQFEVQMIFGKLCFWVVLCGLYIVVELGNMVIVVLVFGDFVFEGCVVDRMIFYFYCYVFDFWVVIGFFGYGLVFQCVFDLQVEVVVFVVGMV